jgi:hypothetical protein
MALAAKRGGAPAAAFEPREVGTGLTSVGGSAAHLRKGTAMATIHVTQLEAVRIQDIGPTDEAAIFLAGREAVLVPMRKGEVRKFNPHLSEDFGESIVVELKEKNGSSNYKSLGSTTVRAGIQGPQPVEFKTSGAHYHLWYHLL